MATDTKPTTTTQPLSVRLRELAAKETASADAAHSSPIAMLGMAGNAARATARAQAFNEASAMAEEGEAAGAALAGDVVSGAEYRGVRNRLVAAALDLANARKERDEAVATAERLQRERDEAVADAVRASRRRGTDGASYAAGSVACREWMAKLFDGFAQEFLNKARSEALTGTSSGFATAAIYTARSDCYQTAAAECRRGPA